MKYKDRHLHMSGATPPDVLFEVIKESGYKIGKEFLEDYFYFKDSISMAGVKNLDEYLDIIHKIEPPQSSPRSIEICTYHSFKDCYLSGCDDLELRWNPVKRSLNGKIDLDSLIIAARAGMERAKNTFHMEGSMILCFGRDLSPAENEAIFQKSLQYLGKGISGVDCAGSEKHVLPSELSDFYENANRIGMETTIHVGEQFHDRTEAELQITIETLNTKRIGHGTQIVKFPSLMKQAAKKGIVFEICISSNLKTKVVGSSFEFREIFKTFEKYGINYVICTDATHPIHTNIRKENYLYNQIKNMNGRIVK